MSISKNTKKKIELIDLSIIKYNFTVRAIWNPIGKDSLAKHISI